MIISVPGPQRACMMAPCHCLRGLSKLSHPGGKCITAPVSFENTSPSSIQPRPPAVCRLSPSRRRIHTLWGAGGLHLMGSIWWGAERKHQTLTKCPMDMFYIPWHSLARTSLSTAPDMTWRPGLWSRYLDINGHEWYLTNILAQSHPVSPDTR